MRFRYSFQKIVDLKTNEKTQAEWVLSTAVGRLKDEENSLTDLHTEKSAIQNNLAAAAATRISVSELMLYQSYLDHIDHKITTKHADVNEAKMNVAVEQVNLSAKVIEEKVWVKAREKAKESFTAEIMKKEQEALDEIAVTRRSRAQ